MNAHGSEQEYDLCDDEDILAGQERGVSRKSACRILRHCDDSDNDIPNMSASFQDAAYDENMLRNYLAVEGNKDKVTLTRFLNAGILTAVVCGLQKKFHRRGKR